MGDIEIPTTYLNSVWKNTLETQISFYVITIMFTSVIGMFIYIISLCQISLSHLLWLIIYHHKKRNLKYCIATILLFYTLHKHTPIKLAYSLKVFSYTTLLNSKSRWQWYRSNVASYSVCSVATIDCRHLHKLRYWVVLSSGVIFAQIEQLVQKLKLWKHKHAREREWTVLWFHRTVFFSKIIWLK